MSYLVCPKTAARPLLGLSVRATSSTATSRTPSREALRWLSHSISNTPPLACTRLSIRARFASPTSTYLARATSQRRSFFSQRIPKDYEQLPENYRDEDGLDFRTTELTEDEVDRVFHPNSGYISVERANQLLRILHGRRVAGTLDDPAFGENTSIFGLEHIQTALEYLRLTVPVNEARNAGLRAEDELAAIEREEEIRGSGGEVEKAQSTSKPKKNPLYKTDPVYGPSAFDKIRAKNEAKTQAVKAAREARKRAEEAAAGGPMELAEAKRPGPVSLVNEEGKEIYNPQVAKYYKQAQEQGAKVPDAIPFWQRLLPSATFVTLVVGFLAAMTTVYDEPAENYRMLSFLSTAHATVGTIILANILVLSAWRVPPLWAFLNRNFIFVVGKVRPLTLITANYSHQRVKHLVTNMVALWFLGSALHEEMDRATFLTLYTACGAAGYLTNLTFYTLRGWLAVSSLGASGSTIGVSAAYLWDHRWDRFKIFGMPENGIHGLVGLAFLLSLQIGHIVKGRASRADVACHLGGMAMGVLGMEIIANRRSFLVRDDNGLMQEAKDKLVGKEEAEVKEVEGEAKKHAHLLGRFVGSGQEKP